MVASCTDNTLSSRDHDLLSAFIAAAFDPVATAASAGLTPRDFAQWSQQPHIQRALADLEALHAQAANLQALTARRDAVTQLHALVRDPELPAVERRRAASSLLRVATPARRAAVTELPPSKPESRPPRRSAADEDRAIQSALRVLEGAIDTCFPPDPAASSPKPAARLVARAGSAPPARSNARELVNSASNLSDVPTFHPP